MPKKKVVPIRKIYIEMTSKKGTKIPFLPYMKCHCEMLSTTMDRKIENELIKHIKLLTHYRYYYRFRILYHLSVQYLLNSF